MIDPQDWRPELDDEYDEEVYISLLNRPKLTADEIGVLFTQKLARDKKLACDGEN